MTKEKTILITGSEGFIGTHLLRELIIKNKVIGINNKSDKKIKNYSPIKKDILKLSSNNIKSHLDGIIHLAAISNVEFCNKYPLRCNTVNVLGTLKVLEIARKKDCPLVFMSTSHVYGIPQQIPINEEHPKHPMSIYSTSKLEAEILCEGYAKTYGMDISIMRLFSVYGPNSPSHLVTSRIISQLRNKTISLGNVKSKRDFIYIDDVINAITIILNKSKGFNIFNVGTGKSYSILEVCNILKKLTGSNAIVKPSSNKLRNSDAKEIVSDSSKIQKLGWHPSIKLEKGLKMTLDSRI